MPKPKVTYEEMDKTLACWRNYSDFPEVFAAIRRTLKAVEEWRKEAGELIGVSRGLETVNLLFRIRDFDPGKE